ncbi:MAG: S26 family signal peptidase [Proteobacteria bacterium]|jgi:conjugative transfer signal peptidase TraF|nr:S26 family signal peptidase [Pseudomonadota bacterium]
MRDIRLSRHGKHVLAIALGGCAILGVGACVASNPRLVWNATASAPRGLYFVVDHRANRGDLVLVSTPPGIRNLAAERGYIPANVPLVKLIEAQRGDIVCSAGDEISINGVAVAVRRARDGLGRALPHWSGCRALGPDDIFLLMKGASASFDGRYFGITPCAAIIGRLVPLWTE